MILGCFIVIIQFEPYTIQMIKRWNLNTTLFLILQKSYPSEI